jgi:valyl-tRNA synthetase
MGRAYSILLTCQDILRTKANTMLFVLGLTGMPSVQAQSVNLDIKRVVANRYWCNKLWNAIKFALERLGDDFRPSPQMPAPAELPLACRWVLSRLNAATQKVVSGFETYSFAEGTQVCYFCGCDVAVVWHLFDSCSLTL